LLPLVEYATVPGMIVPLAKPRAVSAAEGVVEPVPPFAMETGVVGIERSFT
jgi:hypothetical protein